MSNQTKRIQVPVGHIQHSDGKESFVPLFGIADVAHLLALAMGYKPEVAHALGVLSRTACPDLDQSGEFTFDVARRAVAMASTINDLRASGGGLEVSQDQADCILEATGYIHKLEAVYGTLENSEEIQDEFARLFAEYNEAIADMNAQRKQPKTILGVLRKYLSHEPLSE